MASKPLSDLASAPTEILTNITKYLIRRDLKALRLGNRRLNDIISESIFRAIIVEWKDGSLLQLKNIATSPKWSKQVNCIYWIFPLEQLSMDDTSDDDEDPMHPIVLDKEYQHLKKLSNVNQMEVLNSTCNMVASAGMCQTADFYELLRPAKLRPRTILIEDHEVQLAYSKKGDLTGFSIGRSARRPSAPLNVNSDAWFEEDIWWGYMEEEKARVNKKPAPDDVIDPLPADDEIESGPHTPASHTRSEASDEVTSIAAPERDDVGLALFESVPRLEWATLRSVTLDSIITGSEFLDILLRDCKKLAYLSLTNIDVVPRVDVVLQGIKLRKQMKKLVRVEINLTDIHQHHCDGQFSATDAELTKWVQGKKNFDLMAKLEDAFTWRAECSEDGDDDGNGLWDDGGEYDSDDLRAMIDPMSQYEYNYHSDDSGKWYR